MNKVSGKILFKFSRLVYHRGMRIFIAILCLFSFIFSVAILHFDLEKKFLLQNEITILTMIDVGQGDGFMFDFPHGQKIFIDIGQDYEKIKNGMNNGESIFDYIFSRETADIIFLTHDDADHAGALPEFSRQIKIGAIGMSLFHYTYIDKIKNNLINKMEMIRGMEFNFSPDEINKNSISILYPDIGRITKYPEGINSRADNAASLIMKFNLGSTSVLFTGDAGIPEENLLLSSTSSRLDLKSDILKVGHHGSKGSTGLEFLKKVNPYMAFISAGVKNKYGHPHPGVISNLSRHISTSSLLRTDECGTVKLYLYKNGAIGRRDCSFSNKTSD